MKNHDGGNRVVISGISGRFPNSNNVFEFQNNLLNGVDCTTTDHSRWDFDTPKVPQRIGAINDIGNFDRVFFGVHSRLTAIMDPGSRLLLEHCFEAIMDAGINPRSLKGANIAVYTATHLSESEKTVFHNKVQQDGFGIMGCSKAMIPNRVSFFLGLNGSSINIDSACTGSGTALEIAYQHIKNGRCDGAIVAGSMLALHPHISYQLRALGLLSPDGVTRSFTDSADGHTRSESVAVLFLQRACDAKRIYQEVVGVRTTHTDCLDINTVLYPKMNCQVNVMRDMLKDCGLTPDDIAYLEASGVALRDADADELNAIDTVYGKRKKPLMVGSIKSIIGNAVSANTVNSIIKMIIASETGMIPPNLNYDTPNSKAECLKQGRVEIPTELVPWTGEYSSVNTTSMCGVFANVILKAPNIEKKNGGIPDDDLPRLVIASGRTEEAVETLLDYMESRPLDVDYLQLLYDIFQSEIDAHLFRGYTIVPAKGLPSTESKKREMLFKSGENKEVWWVFSGMGSQWAGMGEALLKLPVFEAAIRKCDAVLKPHGYDIFKIITDKDPKAFDLIINSFIGIAAIQIGLVDVLKVAGLEPDYIIGHSVGELGCAYADGCFSAEQMIMAALSRGLASVETELVKGSMAAVGLGYDDVKPLCPPDIDVACHNGPESTTISGPAESLKAFVASLTARKIFAREVASSNIAYHSRYIAPAGPKLLERLQKVIPKPNPRSSKWVSTSVPRREWNTLKARLCSAEYHTNNLLSPVLFDETSRLIPANAICIEIAPHGLLQAILKRSLPESCVNIPLTRRGHPDNLEVLLTAFGKMYNAGLQPQIANLYPKVQYPVGRGTPSISSLVKWDHSTDWLVNYYSPIEEVKEGERNVEINLNDEKYKYLQGNVVNGKITVPISLCLLSAKDILKDFDQEAENFVFEDIKIHKLLVNVPENNILELTLMVPKGTGKFEVVESGTLILSGIVKSTKTPSQDRLNLHLRHSDTYELTQDEFYTELTMRGYNFSGDFKNILKSSSNGNHALIRWKNNWVTLIESALQLFTFANDVRQVEVPLSIRKIIIDQQKQDAAIKASREVAAVMDKKLNFISVGGLEIQGLKFSVLPKIFENNSVSLNTLKIVPNIEKLNLSIAASIRLILQLVIENTFTNKMRKIQFVQDEDSPSLSKFNNILRCVPEVSLFRVEAVAYKDTKFNKSLTIIPRDQKYNLTEITQKLKDGKFLLTFVSASEENDFVKSAESSDLKVVLIRKSGNCCAVLLRKKLAIKKFQLVTASKNVREIVNKIKSSKTSENERVIVIVKSKDDSEVSDLVHQLEELVSLERVRIFNIRDSSNSDNPFEDQFYVKQLEQDLLVNVLTPQKVWATLRRCEVDPKPKLCNNWSANNKNSYDPHDIIWTEGPIVENIKNPVKVEYSSLNSQDILIANGSFCSDPSEIVGLNRLSETSLGLEFSGSDSKGNKVMGVTCGNSMSNIVNADPQWLWNVPKSWSLEDAATIPLSYVVAFSALTIKAEAKCGERVMLYNSCDGLGLAIINLAVAKKCDVFVTYETEAEKKLIRSTCPSLPENRLFKLSGNNFRDGVQVATQGQGVDVVISNQSEIKKLEVFFTMTKRYARVVLISDLTENKIHESVGMEIFLREIALFSVVPKRILLSSSETKKTIVNLIKEGIETGCVKPLAKTVYVRDSLAEAFDACSSNKHSGKIVVKVQPEKTNSNSALAASRLYCSNKKSYIIIEGLTTFGMELIDWLITRGARRFIVASSQKIDSGYKNLRVKLWQSYGVQVVLREKIDLSDTQNIKSLFKEAASLGSIDGVFDLRRMDTSRKTDSVNTTTKIADSESRLYPELRLFIVCSAIENTGSLLSAKKFPIIEIDAQTKEAESIVETRRKDGLPGSYVRFGLIIDQNSLLKSRILLPPFTKYLEKLDQSLVADEVVTDVICVVSSTNEVEDDVVDDDSNLLDPELRDAQTFTAGLYEQYGVHVEGYSYLQV